MEAKLVRSQSDLMKLIIVILILLGFVATGCSTQEVKTYDISVDRAMPLCSWNGPYTDICALQVIKASLENEASE